ncbi:MAG: hypothetical protein IPN71_21790 [Fibrobacteres bacterium]|nr:hypothetical protein [Fibrobacterota bacterium]
MTNNQPTAKEVKLGRDYSFMYENFALITHNFTYLLLEKEGDLIRALCFDSSNCKYGGPNDEAHSGHPLSKYGLGHYGLFEIENSPWINELMSMNRVHPNHFDGMYSKCKHYIACFKDEKFECICTEMKEISITSSEFSEICLKEISNLSIDQIMSR